MPHECAASVMLWRLPILSPRAQRLSERHMFNAAVSAQVRPPPALLVCGQHPLFRRSIHPRLQLQSQVITAKHGTGAYVHIAALRLLHCSGEQSSRGDRIATLQNIVHIQTCSLQKLLYATIAATTCSVVIIRRFAAIDQINFELRTFVTRVPRSCENDYG